MKRPVVILIILLPVVSVFMGALMFYLALSTSDPVVETSAKPLSKTSFSLEQGSDP